MKQVVDLIFGDNSTMKAFRETVLVEYPRKGTWSLGFVTGNSFSDVRAATGGEVVSVFIPTSPTPMTGFVINVPREDAVSLDISIDQALRFIITAGVLTPEHVDPPVGRQGSRPGHSVQEIAAQEIAAEQAAEAVHGSAAAPGVEMPSDRADDDLDKGRDANPPRG